MKGAQKTPEHSECHDMRTVLARPDEPQWLSDYRYPLGFLLAFGVVFRIILGTMFFPPNLLGWGSDYWGIASNLAAGDGYSVAGKPTAILTPAYPLALALFRVLFGPSPVILVILQSLVCAGTGYFVFRIGGRIYGRSAGLWACGLYAVNPYLARYEVSIIEGCGYPFSLALLIFLLLKCETDNKLRGYVWAGVVLGATYLVRPTIGAFAPLAALWLVGVARDRSRAVLGVGIMTLTCMVVVSPWPIRNALVFHRFVLSRTNGGQNLWFGNNEYTDIVYPSYSLDCLAPALEYKWHQSNLPDRPWPLGDFDRQSYYSRLASDYIRAHPWVFVRRALIKTLELCHFRLSPVFRDYANVHFIDGKVVILEEPVARDWMESAAYTVPFILVASLGIIGLVSSWSRRREAALILLLLAANTLVYAVYFGTSKNRVPTDILLMVFAGHGVIQISNYVTSTFRQRVM